MKYSLTLAAFLSLVVVALCAPRACAQAAIGGAPATPEDIATLRERGAASEQLTEEERKEFDDLLNKAQQRREKAAALSQEANRLQKEMERAGEPLAPPAPAEPVDKARLAGLSPDELRAEVTVADQQVSEAKSRLAELTAEIERRAQRRQEIPAELVSARESLANAEQALATPVTDESPLLVGARRLYQQAHRDRWQRGVQFIEQEGRTYEAAARRLTALRDAATTRVQAAEERQRAIAQVAAEAQKQEAERKAAEAKRAARTAHPALKEVAERNTELAEKNRELVERRAQLDQRLAEAREQAQTIDRKLEDVQQRVEKSQDSPVIGTMLRSEQDQLPRIAPLRQSIANRPSLISQLRLDQYDWHTEREALLPIEETVNQQIARFEGQSGEELPPWLVEELRKMLEYRAELLSSLDTTADDCLQRLADLNTAEGEVVATTEELSSYIAERVFWVPSAPTLSPRELIYVRDFWANPGRRLEDLQKLGATVLSDARRRPETWLLASIAALLLISLRQRAKRQLYVMGEAASRPYATQFLPTVRAAIATLYVSAPTALIVGFLGWRLSTHGVGFSYATGRGLSFFATAYLTLNLVRHACRPGGLAAQHFDWDQKALTSIRRARARRSGSLCRCFRSRWGSRPDATKRPSTRSAACRSSWRSSRWERLGW